MAALKSLNCFVQIVVIGILIAVHADVAPQNALAESSGPLPDILANQLPNDLQEAYEQLINQSAWQPAPSPTEVKYLHDQALAAERRREVIDCHSEANGCESVGYEKQAEAAEEATQAAFAKAHEASLKRISALPSLLRATVEKAKLEQANLDSILKQVALKHLERMKLEQNKTDEMKALEAAIEQQKLINQAMEEEDRAWVKASAVAVKQVQQRVDQQKAIEDVLASTGNALQAVSAAAVQASSKAIQESAQEAMQQLQQSASDAVQQVEHAHQGLLSTQALRTKSLKSHVASSQAKQEALEAGFRANITGEAVDNLAPCNGCRPWESQDITSM